MHEVLKPNLSTLPPEEIHGSMCFFAEQVFCEVSALVDLHLAIAYIYYYGVNCQQNGPLCSLTSPSCFNISTPLASLLPAPRLWRRSVRLPRRNVGDVRPAVALGRSAPPPPTGRYFRERLLAERRAARDGWRFGADTGPDGPGAHHAAAGGDDG